LPATRHLRRPGAAVSAVDLRHLGVLLYSSRGDVVEAGEDRVLHVNCGKSWGFLLGS
jgi:hypothetical protein